MLTAWYDYLISNPNLNLGADLVLYLRTRPERALERLRDRSRKEESLIQEQMVQDLHSHSIQSIRSVTYSARHQNVRLQGCLQFRAVGRRESNPVRPVWLRSLPSEL